MYFISVKILFIYRVPLILFCFFLDSFETEWITLGQKGRINYFVNCAIIIQHNFLTDTLIFLNIYRKLRFFTFFLLFLNCFIKVFWYNFICLYFICYFSYIKGEYRCESTILETRLSFWSTKTDLADLFRHWPSNSCKLTHYAQNFLIFQMLKNEWFLYCRFFLQIDLICIVFVSGYAILRTAEAKSFGVRYVGWLFNYEGLCLE